MKSTLTILQLPSSTTRPRLRPYGRVKPLLVITAMLAASAITMIDAGKAWGQFLTQGTATPSERCGVCHQETYREFATGFGSDLEYPPMILGSLTNDVLTLPTTISGSATAHAYAGVDPWPIQARVVENNGQSCNVCHFPQPLALPDMDVLSVPK